MSVLYKGVFQTFKATICVLEMSSSLIHNWSFFFKGVLKFALPVVECYTIAVYQGTFCDWLEKLTVEQLQEGRRTKD